MEHSSVLKEAFYMAFQQTIEHDGFIVDFVDGSKDHLICMATGKHKFDLNFFYPSQILARFCDGNGHEFDYNDSTNKDARIQLIVPDLQGALVELLGSRAIKRDGSNRQEARRLGIEMAKTLNNIINTVYEHNNRAP